MSLVSVRSRFLTMAPHVWMAGGDLRAETSLFLRALTLFSYRRSLHVDRKSRYLFLDRTVFWFFTRGEVVPFRTIKRIEYSFSSLMTSWDFTGQVHDRLESFSVDLVLDDDRRLPLFSFRGPGAVTTGWLGVALGDSLIDHEGTQEDASRQFVSLLESTLGVPLGEPMPVLKDSAGKAWRCVQCRRPGPPREGSCLYCRGALSPEDAGV